jgi:hypothetical protein
MSDKVTSHGDLFRDLYETLSPIITVDRRLDDLNIVPLRGGNECNEYNEGGNECNEYNEGGNEYNEYTEGGDANDYIEKFGGDDDDDNDTQEIVQKESQHDDKIKAEVIKDAISKCGDLIYPRMKDHEPNKFNPDYIPRRLFMLPTELKYMLGIPFPTHPIIIGRLAESCFSKDDKKIIERCNDILGPDDIVDSIITVDCKQMENIESAEIHLKNAIGKDTKLCILAVNIPTNYMGKSFWCIAGRFMPTSYISKDHLTLYIVPEANELQHIKCKEYDTETVKSKLYYDSMKY